MISAVNLTVTIATALGLFLVGGGLYEFLVVDPFWPGRPDLIQPARGGISRKRFWIPAHTFFELTLIIALVIAWNTREVREWLLFALSSHAAMRIWSAFDFIPKALAFEKAAAIDPGAARSWSRRSRFRLPLDLFTCLSLLIALSVACHA